MKKFFAQAALGAAALFCVGAANAYVIDFDGADASAAPFAPLLSDWDAVSQGPFTIGAFNFNNLGNPPDGSGVGALVGGASGGGCLDERCPGGDATTYLASTNDSYVYLWDNGLGMKLSTFDAAFLGPVSTNTTAAFLVFETRRSDFSLIDSGYFRLTINKDGSTPFSHYWIGNATMFTAGSLTSGDDIANIFAYTYYCDTGSGCTVGATNKGQFGIDNINVSSVPEPSSWLLMGLGLVGVAAQVRRRRSN
ncbi:MAG: NF038120 family PEP-CTERM protein [Burkholderiaceae bacterium]